MSDEIRIPCELVIQHATKTKPPIISMETSGSSVFEGAAEDLTPIQRSLVAEIIERHSCTLQQFADRIEKMDAKSAD